jgi:ABC-2 type transport system permease protein
MDKVLAIIKREYVVRVKTRAFLIGTVVSPLFLLGLALLPGLLVMRGGGQRDVTVFDQSGDPSLFASIRRRMDVPLDDPSMSSTRQPGGRDDAPRTQFRLDQRIVGPGESLDEIMKEYRATLDRAPDRAALVLQAGILDGGEPVYYAKNTADFSINALRRAVSGAIGERRLARAGLPADQIDELTKPVDLSIQRVSGSGETREGGRSDFMIAFVFLFFIYMSVLFYGMFVLRGVIEEKHSRIVEVIVSSVKPTQMMLGKLIGVGLVGLTQIGIWALSAAVLFTLGVSTMSSRGMSIPAVPLSILLYFVAYFVLGYFLYATLYAMMGATVSSEEDAQQAQMPITLLLIVPMMIFTMVIANPNSTTSVILSMIPFFAPTLMMLRITVLSPPFWQIALSMAIMVLTILGCVLLAARIYRVGILMYGKRPSIAELGRWLRYS